MRVGPALLCSRNGAAFVARLVPARLGFVPRKAGAGHVLSRRVTETAQLKETAPDMLVPSRSAPGGGHPGRRPVGGHDAHGSPRGRAPALLPPRLAASPRITFAEPSVSARLGGGPGVWTAQDRLGGRARRQAVCRRPLSPCDTS